MVTAKLKKKKKNLWKKWDKLPTPSNLQGTHLLLETVGEINKQKIKCGSFRKHLCSSHWIPRWRGAFVVTCRQWHHTLILPESVKLPGCLECPQLFFTDYTFKPQNTSRVNKLYSFGKCNTIMSCWRKGVSGMERVEEGWRCC